MTGWSFSINIMEAYTSREANFFTYGITSVGLSIQNVPI